MPRTARIKSLNSIFHIMVRSISDVPLFHDNKDKNKFLTLVKRYQIQFGFKVYAYCLMTTHGHFIIDANGADVSKFMHGINQCYAQYFNKRYNRHGHVFQDRFKSIIVSNEKYLITLSAYIHKNPVDMKKYKNRLELYKYSSLGIYLGIREDTFGILDEDFVMQLFNIDVEKARKKYLQFVYSCEDKDLKESCKSKDKKSQYNSERKIINRNFSPKVILEFVSQYTSIEKSLLLLKNNHKNTEGKAISILLMKNFCSFTYKDICKIIGNITQSRVASLCSKAVDLILSKKEYSHIIDDFIAQSAQTALNKNCSCID